MTESHAERPSNGNAHLLKLMDYETRCSQRYRRFFSIVLSRARTPEADLRQLLSGHVRSSDEFILIENGAAILMSETCGIDARRAVQRYTKVAGDEVDIRYAIASFPLDGSAVESLWAAATRRLKRACENGTARAVVSSDEAVH